MAADTVRLLDDGVHAELGDLVYQRVLVPFPVLHHCGQQRARRSQNRTHWGQRYLKKLDCTFKEGSLM